LWLWRERNARAFVSIMVGNAGGAVKRNLEFRLRRVPSAKLATISPCLRGAQRSRRADVLKVDGNLQDAVRRSFQAKKPAGGWPKAGK